MMTASIHPLARPAVHSPEKGNAANTTHQIYSAPSRNPLKLKVKRPELASKVRHRTRRCGLWRSPCPAVRPRQFPSSD